MNLEQFKNWLTLNRNSKYTINTYYNQIKTFFKVYSKFTQENINLFLKEKIDNQAKNGTINSYIYTFKTYAEFLKIDIELPKPKRIQETFKSYITEQELNDICVKLNILTNSADKWALILRVMFYTGMRLKEITELQRKNINLEKKLILVTNTKNGEERLIPFSDKLKEILINYFKIEAEKINAFNTTRPMISHICKVIKENFNIDFHPHTLRHSGCHYFLDLLNNKYDVVQKIMGHKDIQQTIAYSLLSQEEMINLVQNAFKDSNKKRRKQNGTF